MYELHSINCRLHLLAKIIITYIFTYFPYLLLFVL
nr:MAG TPA: hypothetical protein [Caudoviricetes sp.]